MPERMEKTVAQEDSETLALVHWTFQTRSSDKYRRLSIEISFRHLIK